MTGVTSHGVVSPVAGFVLRVQRLMFGVQGLVFRTLCLRFKVTCCGSKEGSRFRLTYFCITQL